MDKYPRPVDTAETTMPSVRESLRLAVGHDGDSAAFAALVDDRRKVVMRRYIPRIAQHIPRPAWIEQDPH